MTTSNEGLYPTLRGFGTSTTHLDSMKMFIHEWFVVNELEIQSN